MRPRVLIVEDESDVGRLLSFNLGEAGFDTRVAQTGADGLAQLGDFDPHVVVLDLMLPDISGYEICRRLRGEHKRGDLGVLILTARGDEDDRIEGLEAGADDYVVKPFSVREVVLRVKALAKRTEREQTSDDSGPAVLEVRGLRVDTRGRQVSYHDTPLSLRPLEFKMLATLMSEPGRVFSRNDLLESVWGIQEATSPRTVDVHIKRLRSNLGEAADLIETVHGFGYRTVSD